MSEASAEAIVGGGCFWCIEAVYQRLRGVISVDSGYAGGHVPNPTYRQICEKTTGHAEVCRIVYDPAKLSYRDLLGVFFAVHDPTTKDQQGNDVGPQYRSIILTRNSEQEKVARELIEELKDDFPGPIVTEVKPLETYYRAEEYHQNYFVNNPTQGYCQFVVAPKVKKFLHHFSDRAVDVGG